MLVARLSPLFWRQGQDNTPWQDERSAVRVDNCPHGGVEEGRPPGNREVAVSV